MGMNAIFNHLTEIKRAINITSKVIKCGINIQMKFKERPVSRNVRTVLKLWSKGIYILKNTILNFFS